MTTKTPDIKPFIINAENLDALQQDAEWMLNTYMELGTGDSESDSYKFYQDVIALIAAVYRGETLIVSPRAETDTERHLTMMRYLSQDMMDGIGEDD